MQDQIKGAAEENRKLKEEKETLMTEMRNIRNSLHLSEMDAEQWKSETEKARADASNAKSEAEKAKSAVKSAELQLEKAMQEHTTTQAALIQVHFRTMLCNTRSPFLM